MLREFNFIEFKSENLDHRVKEIQKRHLNPGIFQIIFKYLIKRSRRTNLTFPDFICHLFRFNFRVKILIKMGIFYYFYVLF